MKILAIHADYIRFTPTKKAIRNAEEADKKTQEVKECLVIFTAVEKQDEANLKAAAKNLAEETEKIAKQVKPKNIVLYPYAHLSTNLALAERAVEVLKEAEKILKRKHKVVRAPFGWYKAFELSCKGHPLSELSREITSEEKITREEVTKKIKSEFVILTQNNKEYKIDLKDEKELNEILKKVNNSALKSYIFSEEVKGISQKEPPSIKEMQRQELVGYAPESDSGNFKLFPKGNLIFQLIIDWANEIAINRFKAMEIDTPVLYDWSDKEIREQAESFHQRHYVVKVPDDPKKELILRFAGDFGLFKMVKRANISYKNLPLRIYEFSKSFRYEKRSELSGFRRLRAFHMPDIHCFCENLEEGWKEYQELYKQYDDLAKATGIEFAVVFRTTKDFYKKYKEKFVEMLKYSNLPALIEIMSEMKHYWVVKHEFQGIDSVNTNTQLSTVQLDIKDSETYGITYIDKNGNKKGCIICHSSVGSIERWFYAILENSLKSKTPTWPLWLSPSQIRIIPVSNKKHLKFSEKLTDELEKNNIRVDIDDNIETVNKRILNAEKEWIPFILVVGDKELNNQPLTLRTRGKKEQEKITSQNLIKKIKDQTKDMPYKPLPLPRLLTKRPVFQG